jgi:hypothetical protein
MGRHDCCKAKKRPLYRLGATKRWLASEVEKLADLAFIIHGNMQVDTGGQQTAMAGGKADLGQTASSGKRVANEGMPAMVDGQSSDPGIPQDLASGLETASKNMAIDRPSEGRWLKRAEKRIPIPGALGLPPGFPFPQVFQGPGVPPERDTPRAAKLSRLGPYLKMGPILPNPDVHHPQSADLACAQSATAGQSHEGQVQPNGSQAVGPSVEICDHSG